VTGRPDRVEPVAVRLQPPGREIGVPAAELRVVQAVQELGRVVAGRGLEGLDALGEELVDLAHAPNSTGARPAQPSGDRSIGGAGAGPARTGTALRWEPGRAVVRS
jgi:hypothetical protein